MVQFGLDWRRAHRPLSLDGESILYIALPLALSTVAIVLKYVVQVLQSAQQFLETTQKSQGE